MHFTNMIGSNTRCTTLGGGHCSCVIVSGTSITDLEDAVANQCTHYLHTAPVSKHAGICVVAQCDRTTLISYKMTIS